MALPNVLGALHAAFETNPSLLAKVPGGLWTGEVPDRDPDTRASVEKPYCRVDLEGSEYDWLLGTARHVTTKFCFTVVAVGAEACQQALDALEDEYTWGDLSFPGSTASHVRTLLLRRDMRSDPTRDPDGNVLYVGVLLYDVLVFIPE